jgi:membrane protease YdiL (CAAX protease family)
MNKLLTLTKRYPLIAFFLLSYLISWPAWFLEAGCATWTSFPGYFGPAIAAVIIVALTRGRSALEELFARIFRWRVSLKWYLGASLLPMLIILAVIPVQLLINPTAGLDPAFLVPLLPRLLLMLVGGTLFGMLIVAGEEIGWRGYALPRLLQRHKPLSASLIVGIGWGFWHLPLIWLFYADQYNPINALLYALGFLAASVFYTWLHLRSNGSILIASLFHSVFDTVGMLAGGLPGNLFSFRTHMLVWVAAAIILSAWLGWLRKDSTQWREDAAT